MAEALTFKYDREGDILYIDKVCPYAEQETEELGDDVIARLTGRQNVLRINLCGSVRCEVHPVRTTQHLRIHQPPSKWG